jgi:hypothetical protein
VLAEETMPRMTHILNVLFANDGRPKIPICWSAERIQGLRDMANGTGMRCPLDDQLASAMLLCAEGQFAVAENQVLRLLRDHGDLAKREPETFISFMAALYVLQQFGLVAAMLFDRFGFNGEFSIDAEENGPGLGRIRWEISRTGVHRFVFDAKSFQYDKTGRHSRVLLGIPVICQFLPLPPSGAWSSHHKPDGYRLHPGAGMVQ